MDRRPESVPQAQVGRSTGRTDPSPSLLSEIASGTTVPMPQSPDEATTGQRDGSTAGSQIEFGDAPSESVQSAADVTAGDAGTDASPGQDQAWSGQVLTPWIVGNPGRSIGVVPKLSGPPVDPPDTIVDGAQVGALTVRAASVRGLSHRYYATPRQDAYAFALSEANDHLIAVVADGVSAGKYSHKAARIVTALGVRLVARELGKVTPGAIDWGQVLQTISQTIVTEAGHYAQSDPADEQEATPALTGLAAARLMASTAMFAVVAIEPDDSGSRDLAVMAIGDTSAWILRDGGWLAIGDIKNEGAQIASSATAALPLIPESLVPQTLQIGSDDRLFLMSDGVGDPLGNGKGDVGRFLASVWANPPSPLDFAAQVGFARKSFDDDRTVVAIWPSPGI